MNMQAEQPNPYAAPQAIVRDATAGEQGTVLAGRGSRLGAVTLDSMIFGLFVYTPLMIGIGLQGMAALAPIANNPMALYGTFFRAFTTTAGLYALVGLGICVALNVYFVKKNGQSVGKKLVGIKVVRTDGSPANLARIFWLRNVVNLLPTLVPFVGSIYNLVDQLFIFSESRRCVHDRIADTMVIKA